LRYDFIHEQEKAYPIKVLCKVMEVTRSAYYRYIARNKIVDQDLRISFELKVLHKQCKGSYGSRRMVKALSLHGYKIGRYKVRRLMRQNGISCKQRRRYIVTTCSTHALATAENLLNRNFNVKKPNQKWVADITYIWTTEGWLYLAAILDLYSRRIVGWSMADHMKTDLVENAFMMAKSRRLPSRGLLHHSDRGIQYASQQYLKRLYSSGVVISMSRKGNCWDNAVMERFFGTLKTECTNVKNYTTRAEAKKYVVYFIEIFYNNERLHSTLDYLSPVAYERKYVANNLYD
jgi:putative transposase